MSEDSEALKLNEYMDSIKFKPTLSLRGEGADLSSYELDDFEDIQLEDGGKESAANGQNGHQTGQTEPEVHVGGQLYGFLLQNSDRLVVRICRAIIMVCENGSLF